VSIQRLTVENPTSQRGQSQGLWRRSYDVDDARAQVSQVYWETTPKNENYLNFAEVFAKTVKRFAVHIREKGKQLPVSKNAQAVLEALFEVMDGKTGRCDPSLDTIATRSGLSRRTTVRQLNALRELQIINWVRRTVKTGNAKGQGPQRQQTSNAYFIDLLKLPIEIVRTLRQKLGDKLRETAKHLEGSGKVPNRMAIKIERMTKGLVGVFTGASGVDHAARQQLAGASPAAVAAHVYRNDPAALREHEEMLALSNAPSASANLALYPPVQNLKEKD
jgi:AraC-like DNA-binding protein